MQISLAREQRNKKYGSHMLAKHRIDTVIVTKEMRGGELLTLCVELVQALVLGQNTCFLLDDDEPVVALVSQPKRFTSSSSSLLRMARSHPTVVSSDLVVCC